MPVGLVVYNDTGALQIDSLYRNMSLVSRGTLALNGSDQGTCYADVPRTPGTPVIAWRSDFPVSRSYAPNGDFRLSANLSELGKPIQYYVFDWPKLITPGNSGLQVYDGIGELIFDSNMRWFKVKGLVSTGDPQSSGQDNSFGARTYATMQASPAGQLTFAQLGGPDPQGNATFVVNSFATGTYATTSGLGWGPVQYYRGAQIRAQTIPPPQGYATGDGTALLIDVTNY